MTIQISRLYYIALSQYVIRFLKPWLSLLIRSGLCPPHPRVLEKSLPVPNGIIAIGAFIWSMLWLCNYETTHIIVPSPPHITSMILRLLFIYYFINYNPVSLSFLSLKLKNETNTFTFLPEWLGLKLGGTSKSLSFH